MRRILVIVAVLVGTLAGVGAPAATASTAVPAGTDWVLVTVPITRDTDTMYMRMTAQGTFDGTGPAAMGHGSTGTFWGSYVDVFAAGGGPLDVTTSEGAMSQRVQILPGGRGGGFGFSGTSSCGGGCHSAGDVVRRLVFVTNGSLSAMSFLAVDDLGVVPATIEMGTGSANITAGRPENAGVGASAAGSAVGATTHSATPTEGIAGGFTYGCGIAVCQSSWASPDGRQGTRTNASAVVLGYSSGDEAFGGPAGLWTWTRSAALGGSLIGAYAPIGGAWTAFASQ